MAEKGAPIGNVNRTKGRPYQEALRHALATYADSKRKIEAGHALRKIAYRHIAAALDGDTTAMRDLADRLDGKPTQPVDANVIGDLTVNIKRFTPAD